MLPEMVSCRTHFGLVLLLPVRVVIVQLQDVYLMTQGATEFVSSAAWRSGRRHDRAESARY